MASIKLNDAVLLKGAIGVVLYMGSVDWDEDKSKSYVGLELSTKIPNGHNGTYHNRTYFKCKPSHGIILPLSNIIRVIKPIELLHKLTELKQVLVQESLRNTITTSPSSGTNSNTNSNTRVVIHGLLLNDSIPSDKRLRKVQLLDQRNEIGDHCLIIPSTYIQSQPSQPREPVDSPSGGDLKPLVLQPLSNGKSLKGSGNRRRSSISGRKYSVTARQGTMYEKWSQIMVPNINSINSIECDGGSGSMKQCPAVQRVDFIMQYFNEWTFKKSNKLSISEVDRMIDFMENLEKYNLVQLLNDYDHLMQFHNPQRLKLRSKSQSQSQSQSDDESGHRLFRCQRMDCVSLMRHSKDLGAKNRDYRKKKVLYFIDDDDTDDFDAVYLERKRASGSRTRVNAKELMNAKDAAKRQEVSQEIIAQEILDKIHCFLCHSLTAPQLEGNSDSGCNLGTFYGISIDDDVDCSNVSDGDLVSILHGIFSKMPEYKRIRNIRSNRSDPLFSKFTTKAMVHPQSSSDGDYKMEEIDDEIDAVVNGVDGIRLTAQSRPNWVGRNFVYDFIEPKYANLKEEMLSGYGLDIGAWNDLYDLSVVIQRSNKSRKMSRHRKENYIELQTVTTSNANKGGKGRGMNGGDETVSSEFVLCLLLYCSFIQIRNLFLSTFRSNKSPSIKVERAHSIFANMGRILKENVNAFGTEWEWPSSPNLKERVAMYHCLECPDGTGKQLGVNLLQSEQLVFNGPVSMTSNLLTAVLFESNYFSDDVIHGRGLNGHSLRFLFGINGDYEEDEGLMLKYSGLKYIDCGFVNHYEWENECLFFNDGNQAFAIGTVMNVIKGRNYGLYFEAMKLFDFVFRENTKSNELKYGILMDNLRKQKLLTLAVQQRLVRLLGYDDDQNNGDDMDEVPEHIEHVFNLICERKQYLKVEQSAFWNLNKKMRECIGTEDASSLSLRALCFICPNLQSIHSNAMVLNDENVEAILQLFQMKADSSPLVEIQMTLNNTQSPNIQKILRKYGELGYCRWTLNLDGNVMKLNVLPRVMSQISFR